MTTLEKSYTLPFFGNVMRTLLRTSDYGYVERLENRMASFKKEIAKKMMGESKIIRDVLTDMRDDGIDLGEIGPEAISYELEAVDKIIEKYPFEAGDNPSQIVSNIRNKFTRYKTYKQGNKHIVGLQTAKSVSKEAQVAELMNLYENETESLAEMQDILLYSLMEGIISDPVLFEFLEKSTYSEDLIKQNE